MSNEVVTKLKKLVAASGNLPSMTSSSATNDTSGLVAMQELDAEIELIENQMKEDLNLSQLGQISERTANSATNK